MKKGIFFLIYLTLYCLIPSCSQNKKPYGTETLLEKAERFKGTAHYDSAIICYQLMIDSIKSNDKMTLSFQFLINIADLHRLKGDFKRSAELFNSINPDLVADSSLFIDYYSTAGNLKYDMGRFSESYAFFTKALEYSVRLKGKKDLSSAECLGNLGRSSIGLNNFMGAEKYLTESYNLYEESGEEGSTDLAFTEMYLGNLYYAEGNFERSIDHYKNSLTLEKNLINRNKLLEASILNNLGNAYYRLTDYDKALDLFNQSLNIRVIMLGDDHPSVADVYNNLGLLYDAFGEPERSIDFYTRSLNIRLKSFGEKQRIIARNYNNIANAYKDIKEYKKAEDYYINAINILDELSPGDLDIGVILINLGEVYSYQSKIDSTLSCLHKSIEIQKKILGISHPMISMTYANLGTAYSEGGNFKRAEEFLRKSELMAKIFFKQGHPLFSQILNEMGKIGQRKHNYKEALKYYQASLANMIPGTELKSIYSNPDIKLINPDIIVLETLSLKANALFQYTHNPELVVPTYETIIKLTDIIRAGYKEESSRLLLSENTKKIFEDAIRAYTFYFKKTGKKEYAELAFIFCEKSKSLSLLETLIELKAKQFAGIPDSLLQKEKELKTRLSLTDKKIFDAKQNPENSENLSFLQSSLVNLKEEYYSLIDFFEEKYPEYFRLKYNISPIPVNKLSDKLLNKSATMIEYFLGEDSVYIFWFKRSNLDIITVPTGSAVISLVEDFRTGMKENNFELYTSAAYELYKLLFHPIQGSINNKELIIIPDGVINYLPFEALISQRPNNELTDYKKLKYLIYEFKISYAYSATLLYDNIYQDRTKDGIKSFIGFAPY